MADSTGEMFKLPVFEAAVRRSGLTSRELAEQVGVDPTTIRSVASGRKAPSLTMLTKLVHVLGGSVADYLSLPERSRWDIKHFRMAAGLPQAAVAQAIGVSPAAVSAWEKHKDGPPAALLPELARLYGADEAELVGAVGRLTAGDPPDTALDAVVAMAELVVALAQSTMRTVSASRRSKVERELGSEVRAHVENALDIVSSALQRLPDDRTRDAAVRVIARLTEVHAATRPD